MSNLKKIQQNFVAHIFDKNDSEILKQIPYKKKEALARLNIYRNNVIGAFESLLHSMYPITKKVLGEKEFAIYVKNYCQKFDSQSGNLDEYGEFFAKLFLRHKLKYLSELARLEFLYYRTYFAPEIKQEFDVKKFKKIAADDFFALVFDLHPSLILFESKYPLYSIWSNIKTGEKNGQFIIIYRQFNDVSLLKLTEEEFLFLQALKKKQKLYVIYQKLCKKFNKEIDIGALINRFIESRVIVNFAIND